MSFKLYMFAMFISLSGCHLSVLHFWETLASKSLIRWHERQHKQVKYTCRNGLLQQCQLWKAHKNLWMGMWFIDTYQWDRENWNVYWTNSDRSWKRLDTAKIKFRDHMHGRSFRGKPHPKHLSVSKNRDFIKFLYIYHFVYVTVNKCVTYIYNHFRQSYVFFQESRKRSKLSMNKMKFSLRNTNYLAEFAHKANGMHWCQELLNVDLNLVYWIWMFSDPILWRPSFSSDHPCDVNTTSSTSIRPAAVDWTVDRTIRVRFPV